MLRPALVALGVSSIGACSLITTLDDLRNAGDASLGDSALDGPATTDADASTTTSCNAIDGGTPCTPGAVDCFAYGTCEAGLFCCSTFGCIASKGAPPSTCVSQGGFVFECDETADCTSSQCCLYHYDSGLVGSSCNCPLSPVKSVTMCKSDDDCKAKLTHCLKTTCYGIAFETCDAACP